ncbi:MAG: fused MFS/spermidine synthase [Kiritimatiellae bacterium]|nr:fused MFS/spermidine synthase [Kiritimatiellia bacterium]
MSMVRYATIVFASGLAVMVLELVAGRLVAPFFGQSISTWAALTGVTLAGVTIGNALGGLLSRSPQSSRPFKVLAISLVVGGAYAAVLPTWLSYCVGIATAISSVFNLQVAISVTLAWLPLMMILGMVTPSAAALCVRATDNGRDIGVLYVCSMAGSALGTLLGGLYLPFVLPADTLYCIAGTMLAMVALAAVAKTRRREVLRFMPETPGTCDAMTEDEGRPAPQGEMTLYLVVFAVGWIGMGLEMAGARLVIPVLGGNHVVWSLLFFTFIGGMGLGGWIGGRIADRFPCMVVAVYALTAVAVIAFLTVSAETRLLPDFVAEWSPAARIVALTVVAFAPLAFALGVATTVLLKFATARPLAHGARGIVGLMYAASSAGCVCGTFITGFWCVGRIPSTDVTLYLATAAVFCALALGLTKTDTGQRQFSGVVLGPVYMVAVAAALFIGGRILSGKSWTDGFISRPLPSEMRLAGTTRLLYTEESPYNVVSVTAKPEDPTFRTLWLDRIAHTDMECMLPERLCATYTKMIDTIAEDMLPAMTNAAAEKAPALFMIGGGGYALPRKWTQPGRRWRRLVVAEIDEAVCRVACAYLDAAPVVTGGVEYAVGDGRRVLDRLLREDGEGTYDVVVGDTISDTAIPYHLVTEEFNARVKRLLRPDGAYMVHVLDELDSPGMLPSLFKTLRRSFSHVGAVAYQGVKDVRQSFIVVASDNPDKIRPNHYATLLAARYAEAYPMAIDGQAVDILTKTPGALVFTDRFSPVEKFVWRVVARDTDRRPIHMGMEAKRLMAENHDDAALTLALETLAMRPMESGAIRVLADYALYHRDDTRALAELKRQAEREAIETTAKHAYAYVLGERGDFAGSERVWRDLCAHHPDNALYAREWAGAVRKAKSQPILTPPPKTSGKAGR